MIQDGAYQDSLRASAGDGDGLVVQMAAGLERGGTYRLTAKRDGYQPYSRTGIRVGSGECGVIPVGIEAQLRPE
ncbi:MAG TPA: hypothetical protein VFN22_05515 [Gemmatimonadales bacterium]|nr:hypothetical protein [Gemmatimonadales bacterium]